LTRPSIRLLTICGSLRASSSNAAVLEALARLAPQGVETARYAGLADLPQFNPDIDVDPPPPAVRSLRQHIAAADAVIVSSPEYAHAQLAETLRTMGAALDEGACVSLPIAGRGLDVAGIGDDPELAGNLRRALDTLIALCAD
jgi:chromate reductase, NAD(P)H dehydrogenase (quinone)